MIILWSVNKPPRNEKGLSFTSFACFTLHIFETQKINLLCHEECDYFLKINNNPLKFEVATLALRLLNVKQHNMGNLVMFTLN